MPSRNLLLVACALSLVQFATGHADAQPRERSFECPHERIQLNLESAVPDQWEFVSNGAPLRRTLVRERQRGSFLICDYGQAGNLRRQVPGNTRSCEATETGFACRVPRRPRRDVLSEDVVLGEGELLNLDTGKPVDRVSRGEIAYLGSFGRYRRLPLLNVLAGAQVAVAGPEISRIRDCADLSFESGGIITVGREFRIGDTLCFRTENGTVGTLTLADIKSDSIELGYDAVRRGRRQ